MFGKIRNRVMYGLKRLGINADRVLLAIFIFIGFFVLYESRNFAPESAEFPRLVATIMLICILIWIVREYLPKPLRTIFIDTTSAEDVLDDDRMDDFEEESTEFSILPLVLFLTGYLALTYLIGFLYAAPIFVIAYLAWNQKPFHLMIFLAVLAAVLVYAFMEMTGVALNDGVIV